MCWMCDEAKYSFLEHDGRSVSRLVFEDDRTYVIVPRESHVPYHLLVVLKEHRDGLVSCHESDLTALGKTIAGTSQALKALEDKEDPTVVYACCFSDSQDTQHVHFHLIPFRRSDKRMKGGAMHWLAEKEFQSCKNRFACLGSDDKHASLDKIETIVAQVKKAITG